MRHDRNVGSLAPADRTRGWLLAAALLSGAAATCAAGSPPSPHGTAVSGPVYERDVMPLLQHYCYDCHGDGAHKGGLALDDFATVEQVRAAEARKSWEAVLRNVTRHEMPPAEAPEEPTNEERETIAQFIERELFKLDPAHPDPGHVVLRRLNRAEYRNAIRDLVGIDFDATAEFPPDDSGYGFDNVGDALSLPPVLFEKYLAAAERILDEAIVTDPIRSRTVHVPASLAKIGFNAVGDRGDGWVHLISLEEDDVAVELPIVAAGEYLVRFQAFATKTGGALVGQGSDKPIEFTGDPGPTRIALALNDTFVTDFVVTTDEQHPGVYEARLAVPSGRQSFRAVMRRQRGGPHELKMLNGRLGTQQPGIVFVKWMEIEGPLTAATRFVTAARLPAQGSPRTLPDGGVELRSAGEVATRFAAAKPTEVILRAHAYAYQAGDQPARMEFRIDGKAVHTFDVRAPGRMEPIKGQRPFSPQLLLPQPETYEARVTVPPGEHTFAAAFVNPFAESKNENPNLRERRLVVQKLATSDLSSDVLVPPVPTPLQSLLTSAANVTDDRQRARRVIAGFAHRAWRRPIAPAEQDRLLGLYELAREHGDSWDAGVKLAMKAALASPHFLLLGESSGELRAETAAATLTTTGDGAKVIALPDIALASRLSFFLWSSVPDDELLDLAERGELRTQLQSQVQRMLASPKARALVDNFAGQWLQIRMLETMQPDKKLFPEFDAGLRDAMQRETELFFEKVLREDRNVFEFLTGDYTYVNGRLAKLYGLEGITGEEFVRVSLAGTQRRGVLTHASVLTLTSNPNRTSPVKRGKWVLENLLGTPPPPPPPNLPTLEDPERHITGTLRQQMEQHRTNATCASCHARMDPIGFGFETFNAIGAWRDKDGPAPIDTSGELATGERFGGPAELAGLLATTRADDFRRCLAEKMLTYALGRGVEYFDRPAVEQIMADLQAGGDRFSALVLAVARSFPFQHQRADARTSNIEHQTSNVEGRGRTVMADTMTDRRWSAGGPPASEVSR
jgi:mono/diheme cytochrome c family protein/PAS domain-containing protein